MIARWRSTNYNGDSLAGGESPVPSVAADGSRVRRRIQLAPDSTWDQACCDFLGYSIVADAVNSASVPCKYIARSIPHAFAGMSKTPDGPPAEQIPGQAPGVRYTVPPPPVDNRANWLWARSAPGLQHLRPLGAGNLPAVQSKGGARDFDPAVGYYDRDKLDLEYRSLTYDVLPDFDPLLVVGTGPLASTVTAPIPDEATLARYVTAYLRTSKRVINLKRGFMYFVPLAGEGNPTPIPEGFPVEVFSGTLTIDWHEVPAKGIPYGAIARLGGCVNQAPFGPGGVFPAQTARFDSWDKTPLFSPIGQRVFDVQYTFQIAYNVNLAGDVKGWNHVLRKVPGAENIDYREVASYRTVHVPFSPNTYVKGNPPFRLGDFGQLFRPDQP